MARMLAERQAQGFNHFSAKVGDDPDADIERLNQICAALKPGQTVVADANRGWTVHGALRVCQGIGHLNSIYIEQPCDTYEECLLVRRAAPQPMILDECIDTIPSFMRAWCDKALDGVNVKTARHGGVSRTRQLRDLCNTLGISVYIQDVWGTAISASAIAHLAASTPPELFLGIWDPMGVERVRRRDRRTGDAQWTLFRQRPPRARRRADDGDPRRAHRRLRMNGEGYIDRHPCSVDPTSLST